MVKNSPAKEGDPGDLGSILGLGRPPGGGSGDPLQYSCLENPMDRGAWWATEESDATEQLSPSRATHRELRHIFLSIGVYQSLQNIETILSFQDIQKQTLYQI